MNDTMTLLDLIETIADDVRGRTQAERAAFDAALDAAIGRDHAAYWAIKMALIDLLTETTRAAAAAVLAGGYVAEGKHPTRTVAAGEG